MIEKELVKEIVEKNIAGSDMFVVDITINTGNIIAVVLDSDSAVSINNCVDVNRVVCEALANAGEDDFELSVYSAGLSEPLKLKRQYLKHIGKDVDVLLKSGKKQRGIMISVDDNAIEIEYEIKEKETGTKKIKKTVKCEKIETDSIKSTKLVIKM